MSGFVTGGSDIACGVAGATERQGDEKEGSHIVWPSVHASPNMMCPHPPPRALAVPVDFSVNRLSVRYRINVGRFSDSRYRVPCVGILRPQTMYAPSPP